MTIPFFQLAEPAKNLEIFGIHFLGVDAQNGRKLAFFILVFLISKGLRALSRGTMSRGSRTLTCRTRQNVSLLTFVLGVLGFVSIWFDKPARLATGVGLIGAGLAFALQKLVMSFAGSFVMLTCDIVGLPPIRVEMQK